MTKNIAFRSSFNPRSGLVPVVLLAAGALLLAVVDGTAAARPLVKDGQIHACYRVKGKPKGELRVVPSARVRCGRGERKVAWSAVGSSGFPGASSQGDQGAQGQGAQGQPGASGSAAPDDAALKAQVSALSLKVESLEGLLAGIAAGDLSGLLPRVSGLEGVLSGVDNEGLKHAVDTVKDVTGDKLLEAVKAVPLLSDVCTQTKELTDRSNLVLGLLNTLDALNVLSLPVALPEFNKVCPGP